MEIMHIVGNRPQFIKLSPVYRAAKTKGHRQTIVHSGQHFDENMSNIFFEELNIPKPVINLHVSGGTHTQMTARMMLALESVLTEKKPTLIIVYGDTNTTLSAALTAKKMCIPLVHVEAGTRTGSEYNPEEINRVIVDRVADLLCAPDKVAYDNLVMEGLKNRSFFSGDVMYDTFLINQRRIDSKKILNDFGLERENYILMTWHRQENTSDETSIRNICGLIEQISHPIICPLHPRTRQILQNLRMWDKLKMFKNLQIIEPIGYLEMIALLSNCRMTLTDSGGLSKESYFAGVKSLFMANLRVWPDLENSGWIHHMSSDVNDNLQFIDDVFQTRNETGKMPLFYGDGKASEKIIYEIESRFG